MPTCSQVLLFIANEGYAVGLAAALASVVQHTQPLPTIVVVDAGLCGQSKERLSQIAPLTWVAAPSWQQLGCDLPQVDGYASQATWLKLFVPQLLDRLPQVEALDRVLYMDCDMVALESLAPLWEAELRGKPLAAVRDFGHPCGHRGLVDLGWDAHRPYFNAGLLLLDLKRQRQACSELRALLVQHGAALHYHDQDALNLLCCREGWAELDHRWNVQGLGSYAAFRTRAEPERPQLFSAAQLAELSAKPAVVHFTGPPTVTPSAFLNPHIPYSSKPWVYRSGGRSGSYLSAHPHRPLFFELLDRTPWAGWRPDQRLLAEAACAELRRFAAEVQEPGFCGGSFLRDVASLLLRNS